MKRFLINSLLIFTIIISVKIFFLGGLSIRGVIGEPRDNFVGTYLSARFAERNNDYKSAIDSYLVLNEQYPEDTKIISKIYHMMGREGDFENAINLAKKHAQLDPKSKTAKLFILLEYIKNRQFSKAISLLEEIDDENKINPSQFYSLITSVVTGWSAFGDGREQDAIDILSKISEDLLQDISIYNKAMIYDLTGNVAQAKPYFDKLLTKKINYQIANLVLNYYRRSANTERINKMLSVLKKDMPSFSESENYFENYDLVDFKNQDAAVKLIAQLFLDLDWALINYDDDLLYLQMAAYLDENSSYVNLTLAKEYELREEYKRSNIYYGKIPQNSILYNEVRINIAKNHYSLGSKQRAKKMLQSIYNENPQVNYQAILNLGDFLSNDKNYSAAEIQYSKALAHIKDDYSDKWIVYYVRGICYERLGKWSLAENDFKSALKLNPNQPDVLNYLAYSWLVDNKNIAEAEKMLKIALKYRPADPYIMDSYGFALYKQGQYNAALKVIEYANLLMPYDPTINDHLGDVYWKMGRQIEAVFQWKRALSFDPESEDIAKIKSKIEGGLPLASLKSALSNTEIIVD